MNSRAMVVMGLIGAAAGHAVGQVDSTARGPLQRLRNGIEVHPLRIAPAVRAVDGFRQIGDWVPYGDVTSRACEDLTMVFDCIEQTGTCQDGYFGYGTNYCNMFITNDMTVAAYTDPDAGLRRVDFAWQWICGGFGTEQCIVGVFTQESVPCEADTFDYAGWLLDFGALSCNPGGYYYTNADLGSLGVWPVPDEGAGSYALYFAQEVTDSGGLVLATCSQPVLWATGEDRGDPGAPGTQGPLQLDDDVNLDGSHTSSECYDYMINECVVELGAAAGFWQERCGGICDYADYDGDGSVSTQDFLAFLNSWNTGEIRADCDGDSAINTRDILCFLDTWTRCR